MTQQEILRTFGLSSHQLALSNGTQIEIESLVRVVPGKRIVCRAQWCGQEVYAKLFFGHNAQRYCQRDKKGVDYLVQSNIPTPPLLFEGELSSFDVPVLIFAAIQSSDNAEVVWLSSSNSQRFAIALRLMKEVARHHAAGLLQTDLYLKNFLVSGELIYTLDGDGVRYYSTLSKQKAYANLATLLSKFDVLEIRDWLPDLLSAYAASSRWQERPDLNRTLKWINLKRKQAAIDYADKKVFRKCTDVEIQYSDGYFQAWATQNPIEHSTITAKTLDSLIDIQVRLKSGNTCTVTLASIQGVECVIKRYNIKGFWHRIERALRQTRAATSWSNAHRLTLLGINTPKPIALIENRHWGFRGKAYFISEYLDAPDAAVFFSNEPDQSSIDDAVRHVVLLFYRMYLLKISHGDMKATNLKLFKGVPWLIDLDSMRQHHCDNFALKAHVKDLKRFMKNWQDAPSLYNAFIQAFYAVYEDSSPLRLAGLSKN